MALLSIFILSLLLTIALTPVFIRAAVRLGAYDIPDERKVHRMPIPRIGGIAMAFGLFIPVSIYRQSDVATLAYMAGAAVIVAIGIIDDLKGLGFKIKFAGQIAAALIATIYGDVQIVHFGDLLPDGLMLAGWGSIAITVLVIVGVTNAINLADGLDGLAGGISLLSFLCIGYLAYLGGNTNITILTAALAGVIFGFLRFNTHPATLFMGDTGSQLLGFSAAYLSISLTQNESPLSPLLPLIILGFPILDTLTVMCERVAKGQSPFCADKNHFHHKLLRVGFYHTEAVFTIYVIQAVLIVTAFMLRFHSEWVLLTSYALFSALTLFAFYFYDTMGLKIRRFRFIDMTVKKKLRDLKDKGFFIKIVFMPLEILVPLLIIVSSFLFVNVPVYLSTASLIGVILFGVIWFFRRDLSKNFLIVVLYTIVPVIIFLSETDMIPQIDHLMQKLYNLSFLLMALLSLVSLRLTRREKGFRMTPTHFLIIFIILGLFLLPESWEHYRDMVVKIILVFFTYEIIIGEVRDKIGKVALITMFALLVVTIRGFWQ